MKPSDFFFGVSEFFSILLPGVIVTIITVILVFGYDYRRFGTNEWALLLIASYIVGHILFAIGSWWDLLYEKVKPAGNEELIEHIKHIRNSKADSDCSSVNQYKWSKAVLAKFGEEGYAEVLRKESDSKLFRSLIAPALFLSFVLLLERSYSAGTVGIVIAVVLFWRYREQRFKACTVSYTNVMVLQQLGILDQGRSENA